MEEYEKIELRSEDVQEILGTPPRWIVRWGTTVLFIGMTMLGLVSWHIKYPDEIPAPLNLTTTEPPVPVVARATGYLSTLLVKDGDSVSAGQLLVVLQNAANYKDVLKLEADLHHLDSMNALSIVRYQAKAGLFLGDLQPSYSSFVQLLKEYAFKQKENFGIQNIEQLLDNVSKKNSVSTQNPIRQSRAMNWNAPKKKNWLSNEILKILLPIPNNLKAISYN
jgi:multidrug resistance efflux pump